MSSTWPFGDQKSAQKTEVRVYKNAIDEHEKIEFYPVDLLVEIFPSPLPVEDPHGDPIETAEDLLMMSGHYGYSELYVPQSENIRASADGEELSFSRFDYLSWQLLNLSNETLYWLANKTDTKLEDILDFDVEFAKDSNYDPESWLHASDESSKEFQNGLCLIERLKKEATHTLCTRFAEAICNEYTGVDSWLETPIDEDVSQASEKYSDWPVPIMVVSKGSFFTYKSERHGCLMREQWSLASMFIRNYDEGDI